MRRAAVAALAVLALAACTSADDPIPKVEGTIPPPTSTTAPRDFSQVRLPVVPGRTTTTIFNGPGNARLAGRVTGPDGAPVPSATVRVQRFVGDAVITRDVRTNLDGTWRMDLILGGRYRVRAWRSPDLVLREAEVFFLEGRADKVLQFRLEAETGVAVTPAFAPSPSTVGEPANLVVQVTVRAVDGNGVIRATPQPGAPVLLTGPGQWSVSGSNPQLTDTNGRVSWQLTCLALGPQPLNADVGGQSYSLNLPACRERVTTTTTEPGAVAPPEGLPSS